MGSSPRVVREAEPHAFCYSRQQLVIGNPALAERKVSGVFEPAGGAGFAKALEAYGIAHTTTQNATTIVLDSPR